MIAVLYFCRDRNTDLLTIKVIDEDRLGSDDLIGIARTPLAARADGKTEDLWLPVLGSNDRSRLHLSVTFVPLTGATRSLKCKAASKTWFLQELQPMSAGTTSCPYHKQA